MGGAIETIAQKIIGMAKKEASIQGQGKKTFKAGKDHDKW